MLISGKVNSEEAIYLISGVDIIDLFFMA